MSPIVGYPYEFSPTEIASWRTQRQLLARISSVAFLGILGLVFYFWLAGSSGIPGRVFGFMVAFAVVGCVNSYFLGVREAGFQIWDASGLVLGQGILFLMMAAVANRSHWTILGTALVFVLVASYVLASAQSPGSLYGHSGSFIILVSVLNSFLLATLIIIELGPAHSPTVAAVRFLVVLLAIYAVLLARRTFMVYQMVLQGLAILAIASAISGANVSVKIIFAPIIATVLLCGSLLALTAKARTPRAELEKRTDQASLPSGGSLGLRLRLRQTPTPPDDTPAGLLPKLAVFDEGPSLHHLRLAHYVYLIGAEMGLPDDDLRSLLLAAPLHDMGKIGIPEAILLKRGPLTRVEREVMKTHTEIGARLLREMALPAPRMAEIIALAHHERFDGRGYPFGLIGDEIPLSARITAVADVFDAFTSERVYRPAHSLDTGLGMILAGAGSEFDPAVVGAFEQVQERIVEVLCKYPDGRMNLELLDPTVPSITVAALLESLEASVIRQERAAHYYTS